MCALMSGNFLCVCVFLFVTMAQQAGALAHGEEKQGRGGGHRSARVGKEGGENGMMFFSVVTQVVECVR